VLTDEQLRRVADPALIRRRRFKLLLEDIRRNGLVVIANGGVLVPTANAGLEPQVTPKSRDSPDAGTNLVLVSKLTVDARTAVVAATR